MFDMVGERGVVSHKVTSYTWISPSQMRVASLSMGSYTRNNPSNHLRLGQDFSRHKIPD
ncbi:hypothetical protein TRVA0_062S00518 [Trichomonascus vanleenenianus]|uniref:uncharacterized protein n=1 Tax=Trichomonascus vanleenenianus TaxID=2268995 RepID=UPI003ECAFFD9